MVKTRSFNNPDQNKIEKRLEAILDKYFPGTFKYVGAGELTIGKYNPDYVSIKGSPRIIEILGCFWHSCAVCGYGDKKEQAKAAFENSIKSAMYGAHGYKTLKIWEHEFEDSNKLMEKLTKFING